MDVSDFYTEGPPNNQACIDLFKNEWSTKFPEGYNVVSGGHAGLMEDERIDWALDSLAKFDIDIRESNILELGPMEAGHTTMLEKRGAQSITAVEGNSRAFLKCLVVKEMADLKNAKFVFSDILAFMENDSIRYKIGFASGILYHMQDPVRLIELLSNACDGIYIWTHYFDPKSISNFSGLAEKLTNLRHVSYKGESYDAGFYEYKEARDWRGFCGGPRQDCVWLTKDSILNALHRFGFSRRLIREEENIHGPVLSIAAAKS